MTRPAFRSLLACCLIVGCDDGTSSANAIDVTNFSASECKPVDKAQSTQDHVSPQLVGAQVDDMEVGEQRPTCVEWTKVASGGLSLDFIDMYGNCNADWDASSQLTGDGAIEVIMTNQECTLAKCTCPFDIKLSLSGRSLDVSKEELTLRVRFKKCDGSDSGERALQGTLPTGKMESGNTCLEWS